MECINSLDKIPHHLHCPICLEVPKNKVYQCGNGHAFCEGCSSMLQTCPQCREALGVGGGGRMIRNLVVEQMLDDLRLDCVFKEGGCQRKVGRKEWQSHLEKCHFNFAEYGPLVKACQTVGFQDCSFQMNRGNTTEAVQHFERVHGANVFTSTSLQIRFAGFSQLVFDSTNNPTTVTGPEGGSGPQREVRFNPFPGFGSGRKGFIRGIADELRVAPVMLTQTALPIILNLQEEGYAFLIMLKLSDQDKTFSWSPYFWRYSTNCKMGGYPWPSCRQVSCGLKGGTNSLTWKISPVDILNVGESPTDFSMPITAFGGMEGLGRLRAVVEVVDVENVKSED